MTNFSQLSLENNSAYSRIRTYMPPIRMNRESNWHSAEPTSQEADWEDADTSDIIDPENWQDIDSDEKPELRATQEMPVLTPDQLENEKIKQRTTVPRSKEIPPSLTK